MQSLHKCNPYTNAILTQMQSLDKCNPYTNEILTQMKSLHIYVTNFFQRLNSLASTSANYVFGTPITLLLSVVAAHVHNMQFI